MFFIPKYFDELEDQQKNKKCFEVRINFAQFLELIFDERESIWVEEGAGKNNSLR